MFLHPTSVGAHRIYDSHDVRNSIEIETVTLDEFFKDKGNRIDIIKTDIEGAEIAAFQGMREILKKNDDLKILTEFWPEAIRTFGYSPEEGLSELIKLGFGLFHISQLKGETIPIDLDNLMPMLTEGKYISLYLARH